MNNDMSQYELSGKDKSEQFERHIEIKVPHHLYEYLSSGEIKLQLQNLCRICLSFEEENLVPLLSMKENVSLADMLTSFTSMKVLSDDGFPPNICEPCKEQVQGCYMFRIKCEKANELFKTLMNAVAATKQLDDTERKTNDLIVSEIKSEPKIGDEIEDVQYLEDLNDPESDDDTLYIVQKETKKRKRKVDVKDPNSCLEVIASKRKERSNAKRSHVCVFCLKSFFNSTSLSTHVRRKHPESSDSPYSCAKCKESYMSEHDLRLHSALHSKGSVWKCIECHKVFNAKSVLRRHLYRHMEVKRYSCETCGKEFAELYALKRHQRVHTGETLEKKYACHLCDKRYGQPSALEVHMSRHSGARPCVCAVCGKSFTSTRLLASHQLVHTDLKPYTCKYCDKRFRHESTRNTHHRTHTGEKPYVCSTCGKTFIQNSNLTLHMRSHTGERPYACEVCGRKFTSGSSLKTHRRRHTGEKPYTCPICGKSFARVDMNSHMRSHTGERPFQCNVCPKKFVNASRLREHHKMHTGEKPFECAICSRTFPTKSTLAKHLKRHDSKKNNLAKKDVIIVQQDHDHPFMSADNFVFTKNDKQILTSDINTITEETIFKEEPNKEITLEVTDTVPLEVSQELVLGDDSNLKTELLVVDESNTENYQSGLCLSAGGMNFVSNDINYGSDVNLVTVNEGEMSISASSSTLEGATVKLYQLDQSLVQIHSAGGQVTISKITSKMTANFK